MSNETANTAAPEAFTNVKITKLLDPVQLGEGPYWDPNGKVLLFVDILGKSVHRYNPATQEHYKVTLNDTVSLVIPVKDACDQYVVSLGLKLALLTWDGKSDNHMIEDLACIPGVDGSRINDGKADDKGNLWLGTMGHESEEGIEQKMGNFYKYTVDGNIELVATDITCSNGLGWTCQRDWMYYIDSYTHRVDVFEFDADKSLACNKRPFFDLELKNLTGLPDGMTMDSEDNLWVACFDGSKVIKISGHSGQLLGCLEMPAHRITSVAFGGEDMKTLYVTSARVGLSQKQLEEKPEGGSLFSVEGLCVTGTLANPVVIKH